MHAFKARRGLQSRSWSALVAALGASLLMVSCGSSTTGGAGNDSGTGTPDGAQTKPDSSHPVVDAATHDSGKDVSQAAPETGTHDSGIDATMDVTVVGTPDATPDVIVEAASMADSAKAYLRTRAERTPVANRAVEAVTV